VIDTAGIKIDDINENLKKVNAKENSALRDLTRFTKLVEEGLNQVFLVIDAESLKNKK